MTRLSLFDSPLFLGFEHFEEAIERLKKHSDGYPPYNIEHIAENDLRLTLAVAGFTMNELDVELDQNQLIIRGKQTDEQERTYLYRGIASRQFKKAFVLADGMEILGASLHNGLLHIDLHRKPPESHIKKIKISTSEDDIDHVSSRDDNNNRNSISIRDPESRTPDPSGR